MKNNRHLIEKDGITLGDKLDKLEHNWEETQRLEAEKHRLRAELKDITRETTEKLKEAYTGASRLVDIMTGLLGKENELVQEVKQIRKR